MDQNDKVPFTAGSHRSGSAPNFVNAIHPDGRDLFPDLNFDEVRDVGLSGGTRRRWTGPYSINGALSKLWGNHTFKIGADLRRLGIATTTFNENAGDFTFTPRLHRPDRRGEQRPRAGERPPRAAEGGTGRFRPRGVRVVHELLGRLRPGRLARRLELHAELRRAVRARGRPPRDREPADRRLRSDGGQPDRRAGQQDRARCSRAGRSPAA